MPGPRWDPDEGRWVLDDEPPPAPRRSRHRSVEVSDRPDGDVGVPARQLSPEHLAAGILFPPDREDAAGPVAARDRRPAPGEDVLPPSGAVVGRHGADRSRVGRNDHEPRRGSRRAPETSGPEVAPPGDDGTGRARHGGRRRAGDDAARVASDGRGRGRHGGDGHSVDDGYPLDGGDRPAVRRGRTVGLDHHDVPVRPDVRPRPGAPWGDRGYVDHGRPGDPSAGSAADDLGYVTDDLTYGPDGLGYGPEDGSRRDLVDEGGPVRDRALRSGRPDDTAGGRPARGPGRRRGGSGRSDVLPARRRRWPWVIGAAAAVAAAVPIGLVTFGGSDGGSGASRTDGTVAFGTSTGSDRAGSAPAVDAPAGDAPAVDAAEQPAAAQVTYEVTGSGSAGTITFGLGTSVAQVSGAELPWQRTSPAAAESTEYSVTAAGGSGEISCRILVDGAVLSEESADGEYSAVSCSGRR